MPLNLLMKSSKSIRLTLKWGFSIRRGSQAWEGSTLAHTWTTSCQSARLRPGTRREEKQVWASSLPMIKSSYSNRSRKKNSKCFRLLLRLTSITWQKPFSMTSRVASRRLSERMKSSFHVIATLTTTLGHTSWSQRTWTWGSRKKMSRTSSDSTSKAQKITDL